MATQHICLHITHRGTYLLHDKGTETCRIEHTRHAYDALTREPTDVQDKLGHSIQRIRDHNNNNTVGRVPHNVLDYLCYNPLILLDQIIARHTRLALETRSDHYNIRVSGIG